MGCYHQDKTPRTCAICNKSIGEFAWILDLFRSSSGKPPVEWVHATCATKAIETWLLKKRGTNNDGA